MSQCPRDGRPLEANDADGYRYCRCPECRGFWIPGASIERAIRLGGLRNLREGAPIPAAPVSCPDCGSACGSLVAQGVTIDTCPSCRGVWIDRGEAARLTSMFGLGSAVARADGMRPPAYEPDLSFLDWYYFNPFPEIWSLLTELFGDGGDQWRK